MEVSPISIIEEKLSGSTLGERHRSLNQLVRDPPTEVLDRVKLSNKKQVDLVYMGRLANHTKDASVICELLKSEDSMVVSVALQSTWFFTATTHPHMANVRYFEKEVFPFATYHAVCRIVSTFAAFLQDETVAEELYNYVIEWYGRKLAVKLLPKCSVTFIRSQIMDSLSGVPCAQMFHIYKKNNALALEYLEKYLSKEKSDKLPINYSLKMNYDKIWIFLAEENPSIFFNLLDKYHYSIKVPLGHQIMRKVLGVALEKIIQNPDKYSETITYKYIVTVLKGDELERYLLNCMPSKVNDLSPCDNMYRNYRREFQVFEDNHRLCYYDNVFLYLKPEYRLKILMKLHPIKYNGAAFVDRKDFLEWALFEYLSKAERNMWALKKIQNIKASDEIRPEGYFKYLEAGDGISRLQALCRNKSETEKRSKYLEDMVECCKINNDEDALLELLKYVAKRHKNDSASLRHDFLTKLHETFTLHKLSAEHWVAIHDILDYLIVQKEIERHYWSHTVHYVEREYIQHCFLNGLDISESVDKLIQFDLYYTDSEWKIKDPELEFKVFSVYNEKYKHFLLQSVESTDSEYYNINKISNLINSIANLKPKVSITEYPWILDYIKANYDKWEDYDYLKSSLFGRIKKDSNISDMFLKEILENVNDSSFIKFYIMFRSELLINNMQYFLNNSLKLRNIRKYHIIYEKIYTYLMQPLGRKIVEALQEHMSEESKKDSQQQLGVDITYLACLLPPTQREELIRAHAPANLKVDLQNDRHQYEVGGILAKYVKTLNPPVHLETLLPFVGGDYLKYSLSSLLSLSFRKSKSEAKALILDLAKKPVSVKKHSIRLAYFLCPRDDLLPLYKSLWENERNSSIRDLVFTFTFKLLVTEENMDKYQDIWMTLKHFISCLTENDFNVFNYLTTPQAIMPALVTDYCDTCLRTLKQLAANNIDVAGHVSTLRCNLPSCIELLSEEFCEQIITEYLSSVVNKSDIPSELGIFLVDYLVKAKEPEIQSKHLDSTCEIFKEYINNNWDEAVDGNYKYRNIVRDFVWKCCTQSLNDKLKLSPIILLKTISEMLSSTLPQPSVVDLHIALNSTICYREMLLEPKFLGYSLNSSAVSAMECQLLENFGEKISMHLNDFCSQYGVAAIEIFVKAFNGWMSPLLSASKMPTLVLYFISGLMRGDVTQQCFLMAVHLIPVVWCDDEENFKLYHELLTRIIKEGDIAVKMILNTKVEDGKDWFTV